MSYGYFDDAHREYVITTPKTPYPWINYLGTEPFFRLVSHQAAGYCFYRDARLRRAARFRSKNVPTDSDGRYFYPRKVDGDYWSPGFFAVKRKLDAFECRHGIGYTRVTGKRKRLSVEELFFVPLGRECEVRQVTLTNEANSRRKMTLFSFIEFCLWNAWDDQTNFQRSVNTGEVEVDGSTIYHKTEYRERLNRFVFSTPEKVSTALKRYWHELLSIHTLSSPDEKFNRMVNVRNPYQCMVTFNVSRSASHSERGIGRGMGFRDTNQNLLGFVRLIPERARERILDVRATQLPDGSAYHRYQPLAKRGQPRRRNQLQRRSALAHPGNGRVHQGNRRLHDSRRAGFLQQRRGQQGVALRTLKRSFHRVPNNLGPHGLPLIGRTDWNDCLNLNCFSETPDESYQTTENREGKTAESDFITGVFVDIGPEYAFLTERRGGVQQAKKARELIAKVVEMLLGHGWDGDWYLRACDFFGNKVGSKECEDGQSYIDPLGNCSMAGIELGEISSYPPGHKENAGIFCHSNPWMGIAEKLVSRSKYGAWLTGTAPWNSVAVAGYVPGVKAAKGMAVARQASRSAKDSFLDGKP